MFGFRSKYFNNFLPYSVLFRLFKWGPLYRLHLFCAVPFSLLNAVPVSKDAIIFFNIFYPMVSSPFFQRPIYGQSSTRPTSSDPALLTFCQPKTSYTRLVVRLPQMVVGSSSLSKSFPFLHMEIFYTFFTHGDILIGLQCSRQNICTKTVCLSGQDVRFIVNREHTIDRVLLYITFRRFS